VIARFESHAAAGKVALPQALLTEMLRRIQWLRGPVGPQA
jgi:hypothetical protein